MATSSPESPSKKRKQPINGLKRDQPLFAGRHANRSLQQPPDFFTDSLNSSYIPSPSPEKSPTRRDIRARPRQALGSGRSLGAAFKAKSRANDENRPPSSGSSSEHKRVQQPLKPGPVPSSARTKAISPTKATRSPARNKTPSPPRGRQSSITSPANSESSPGRGYAEAYQRIVEEENLAQEDSIDDMEELGDYGFNEQDRSQDLERVRLQRLRQTASPMSLKASRRVSPRGASEHHKAAEDGMDDNENRGHESDSESGVDYSENITDTSIDSGSSQYAKDLQRVGALKSGAKAFSKARVGERAGLSAGNLRRRDGSNESLGSSFSAGSLSNRGSDPSINIPKAWGRKAKPGKDWLARINSKSGKFTGDVQKRHSSGDQIIAENQRREWSEPIDQWIASASEVPLPSSEDQSSQVRDHSQGSTPTVTGPRSASVDRRRQWEMNDDDFTGRSLQVSESPPIRIRGSALDRIRDREIQNLEKRAVTTSRLGELREKSSGESLRRTQSNRSVEDLHKNDETASRRTSPRKGSPQKSVSKPKYQDPDPDQDATTETLQEEGEPIPDTPVVVYRNNSQEVVPHYRRSAKNEGEPNVRPNHERKDSHDLLKRLSRVTSESPSPTRQHAVPTQQPSEQNTKPSINQTPQNAKSSSNLKTPLVTGAWIDQTLVDKTPQPNMLNISLKTPLVTGAWIDTPLPTGGRGPPMPTPADPEEQKELAPAKIGAAELIHRLSPNNLSSRPSMQSLAPLKYSGPPLAKSALEEILNEAKTGKPSTTTRGTSGSDSEEDPTLHLGESTIQSLEDLLANDNDETSLLAPSPPTAAGAPTEPESPNSTSPTTAAYAPLLTRLSNLAPSLRASKRNIASLERALSSPLPFTSASAIQQHQQQNQPCNTAGPLHDYLLPTCPHCSHPLAPSSLPIKTIPIHLTLHLPHLYTWPRHSRRPHLTWLGFFTLLAYCLYLIESYARFKYCHPLYARSMVGYGVDINAPRPPFVAVKVLWREGIGGVVWGIVRGVAGVLGWVFGFLFSDIGGGGGGGGGRGSIGSRNVRGNRAGWGPELGVGDDEIL